MNDNRRLRPRPGAGRPAAQRPPTVRPDLPPGRPRSSRAPLRRSVSEFERATRHSGRVRFLKRALPISGLLALLAVASSFFLSRTDFGGVDLGGLRLEEGQLVMQSPKLTGFDAEKRPYSLSADRALQDAEAPSRISLEGISAKLPINDTEFAEITAGNGLYDADKKTLQLGGSISVDTNSGMSLRLDAANIDIEAGQLESSSTVEVRTDRMNVTANGLSVRENGDVIRFTDGVRMTILPFDGKDAEAVGAVGE